MWLWLQARSELGAQDVLRLSLEVQPHWKLLDWTHTGMPVTMFVAFMCFSHCSISRCVWNKNFCRTILHVEGKITFLNDFNFGLLLQLFQSVPWIPFTASSLVSHLWMKVIIKYIQHNSNLQLYRASHKVARYKTTCQLSNWKLPINW